MAFYCPEPRFGGNGQVQQDMGHACGEPAEMRTVRLFMDGPDKLLHIEAEGCVVHITVGLHDMSGELYTSVEVTPAQPADDGAIWAAEGPTAMLVRRRGQQVLPGDTEPT
jgi:hypothetical protein